MPRPKAFHGIRCAALFLLIFFLLAGCSTTTPESPTGIIPSENLGVDSENRIILASRGGETSFSLVCDLGLPESSLAEILRIRDAFRDRLGVDLPLLDSGSADTGGSEIVVAARSRQGCADLLSELGNGEFAVSAEGNKIYIAYKGGMGRMCAIEAFLNEAMGTDEASVPADLNLRGKAENVIIKSTIEQLRDPCILYEKGVYYAYGTGWTCRRNTSGSLAGEWENLGVVVKIPPHADADHWAPEVHRYNGQYWMFTTYHSTQTGHRGCTILVSDSPEGPFEEVSDGPLTPKDWDAIDGTFWVDEDGSPWMIFVHEWTSTDDNVGRMAAARLSDDFTHFITEPVELFRADDAPWAKNGVTDGCWMYGTEDGQLLMLWSNWDSEGYCVGIARSPSGKVEGPWQQDERLLYSKSMTGKYDGGHGMLFIDAEGQMYLSIHSPNSPSGDRKEKPIFIPVREENSTIVWDFGKAVDPN